MNDLIRRSRYGGTALLGFLLWFPVPAGAVPVVFSVGGNNTSASIQPTVDAFRAALGDPNNANNPGPLPSGRREINWDGGGPPVINGTAAVTPFIVFQNTRGATFTTLGIGLTQAAATGGLLSLDLINPTYGSIFAPFSPNRLFTPIGSNITDATFSIPGTNGTVPATVSGFGVVFVDVDLSNTSHLDFFDVQGNSLGSFFVPPGTVPDASFSFLGVTFTTEEIGRVRITTGTTPLGPNDNPAGGVEVVAMDDFLYAEPQSIPEASTLVLMGLGMMVLAALARKKKDVTTS